MAGSFLKSLICFNCLKHTHLTICSNICSAIKGFSSHHPKYWSCILSYRCHCNLHLCRCTLSLVGTKHHKFFICFHKKNATCQKISFNEVNGSFPPEGCRIMKVALSNKNLGKQGQNSGKIRT